MMDAAILVRLVSAATVDAAKNGFTNGSGSVVVTTTLGTALASGPFAGNNCAVQVQVTAPHATFFSNLFGFQGKVTTQAVAIVIAATEPGCIYMLSPNTSTNFNGANVKADCSILMDGTGNFNGANIDAVGIGYAGSTPNENGATFTGATPAPMLPVADPCPEIAGCAYLTANPPAIRGCTSFNGNGYSGALAAGCYNSLNLNGARVTLSGLYIINGSSNFNGATITGSNVTIYVTNSGTPPNFNGANVTLSPPTTGNYTGVLYYQVASNTQSPNFNGATNNLSGLLYAPTATSVNFNGADGGYTVLVFGSANLNGSSANTFGAPPAGQALIKQVVLAE